MSKGAPFILFIMLSVPAVGQLDTAKFRVWDEYRALQWDDYLLNDQRKTRKHGFRIRAITSYQYIYSPEELHLDSCLNVLTVLRRRTSWVRDTIDGHLLEHERIHFDIAELYARKMREQFQQLDTSYATLKGTHALIDSLFKAGGDYQDRYDEDTFYGRSSSTQQRWRRQIDDELKQLNEFSFENVCTN